MNTIVTEKIDLAYEKQFIVKDLSLQIPRGKITAIIGPNGCGKSTTLKAVGRLLKPKGGFIYLDGEDIQKLSARETAKKMAILPQTPLAPEGLKVEELVAYGRYPHQKGFCRLTDNDRELIAWALEATKLDGLKQAHVDGLSGGQRQRAWIAMALAQQTELILLDEPTTYLDLTYQLEVLQLLSRLNRREGRTIVMVLHDLNLASRFADYMIAMQGGRIVSHGAPETVMCRQVLKDTFHIDAEITRDKRTGRPACISYHLIEKEEE